jgi:hypothetical protein
MKAKLLTIASSALFVVASNLVASASTYDVSGGWLFPKDTFSGMFDFTGTYPTWVDTASITIDPIGVVLDDVISSSHLAGPLYSVTVDGGAYSLTFDFTLPTKRNDGIVIFATLFEDVCNRNDRCSDKIIAELGGGSVTPSLSLTDPTPTPTPLPAALPLFAGGLGMIGLIAGRRKRKSAGLPAT